MLLSQASVLSVGSSFIATHEPLIGVFVAVNTVGVLFTKRLKALLYVTISDEIRGFHESANGVHASFTSCEQLTPYSLLQAVPEIAAVAWQVGSPLLFAVSTPVHLPHIAQKWLIVYNTLANPSQATEIALHTGTT